MLASVGDRIVVASARTDRAVREGRVVELRGSGGEPPYLVEWAENGHQGLFFPGSDAVVVHETEAAAPEPEPERVRVKTWTVQVQIVESGRDTVAHAVLTEEGSGVELREVDARGRATRSPQDSDVPVIGDEVA